MLIKRKEAVSVLLIAGYMLLFCFSIYAYAVEFLSVSMGIYPSTASFCASMAFIVYLLFMTVISIVRTDRLVLMFLIIYFLFTSVIFSCDQLFTAEDLSLMFVILMIPFYGIGRIGLFFTSPVTIPQRKIAISAVVIFVVLALICIYFLVKGSRHYTYKTNPQKSNEHVT